MLQRFSCVFFLFKPAWFYQSYNFNFSDTKTSILVDLRYIIIFLEFLLSNEM